MSNGNSPYGFLSDWWSDLEDEYLGSGYTTANQDWSQVTEDTQAGQTVIPESPWITPNLWGMTIGGDQGKNVILRDLYDEITQVMDNPISFDAFVNRYGGLFDLYDSTEESMEKEAYQHKVTSTEEALEMLRTQGQEGLDMYKKFYGIDSDDDYESITEKKVRHAEENILLSKKLERQKLINAGLGYTQTRDKVLKDSLKTKIRGANADSIVDDLTTEFWSKMKVVRNDFEKKREALTQNIDSVITQSKQKIAEKEFAFENNMSEAFAEGISKIKGAGYDLARDIRDLREDYNDGMYETMTDLLNMDALNSECESDSECGDGSTCVNNRCEQTPIKAPCSSQGSDLIEGGSVQGEDCIHVCSSDGYGGHADEAACRCYTLGDCDEYESNQMNLGHECIKDNTGNMDCSQCAPGQFCPDGSCRPVGGSCPEGVFEDGGYETNDSGTEYTWDTSSQISEEECSGSWKDGACYEVTPTGITCQGQCAVGLSALEGLGFSFQDGAINWDHTDTVLFGGDENIDTIDVVNTGLTVAVIGTLACLSGCVPCCLGLSDSRVKENIELVGQSESGINIYEFNMKNDTSGYRYRGIIADELPEHEAVSIDEETGYYKVDYDKIDVDFEII